MREFLYWPQSNKIQQLDKVVFLEINPFTETEKLEINNIDSRFRHVDRVGGGIIAGHKENLKKWHTLYYKNLEHFFDLKIFAGKDQSVYAFTILQNPELVELIKVPSDYRYDKWFYLEDFLN